MRPVTWVICCTDSHKFQLLLRWLPNEQWKRVGKILVIIPETQSMLIENLHYSAEMFGKGRTIEIRTEMQERLVLNKIDAPTPLRIYFRDLLGVKLMLPLTVPTPFMFTDDDFVVAADPSYLFECLPWGSHSGLDGYTETAKDLEALGALNCALGTDIPLGTFNTMRTDAGAWYLPTIDKRHYADTLRKYFNTPHVRRVSTDVGVADGNHTQRFRKLDRRFLSGYLISQGGYPLKSPNYRALAEKRIPRRPPKATLIHYCASGRKEAYMEMLWDHAPDR